MNEDSLPNIKADTITARAFHLVDAKGKVRGEFSLSPHGSPQIRFYGSGGALAYLTIAFEKDDLQVRLVSCGHSAKLAAGPNGSRLELSSRMRRSVDIGFFKGRGTQLKLTADETSFEFLIPEEGPTVVSVQDPMNSRRMEVSASGIRPLPDEPQDMATDPIPLGSEEPSGQRTALPLTCDNCGVCCMHMGELPVSWYGFTQLGDPETLPLDVRKEIEARLASYDPDDGPPDDGPCFWFDAETRKCKHYDYRPPVCRRFELGGDSCLKFRREHGIDASCGGARQ